MLRRLSTQIYLTILLTLLLVVIVAGGLWRYTGGQRQVDHAVGVMGELLANGLPPASASRKDQADAAVDLAKRLQVDMALYSASGERIVLFGRPLPSPPPRSFRDRTGGFVRGRGPPAWAVPLPDGRFIVARPPPRDRPVPRPVRFLVFLGAAAVLIGLCTWPVVRGLTRRLERLQTGVEQFGAGDLAARVDVKGRDEVAKLAESFNTSAARIEALVGAHKLLLANASHELRTPLARIRVGLELMETRPTPERRAAVEADIGELEEMIEEILLLSRLDALQDIEERSEVDVLALAAEEASRYSAVDVSGTPVVIEGDARLLRRLVRNLIDNAFKHGEPPVGVSVSPQAGGGVLLRVSDEGSGVSADLAERVFEPFHRGRSRGKTGGSGLGLALVRSIAERHGGAARFEAGSDGRLNRVVVQLA